MKQERDKGAASTPLQESESVLPLKRAADMIADVDESKKFTAAKNLIARLQKEREQFVRDMQDAQDELNTLRMSNYQTKTMALELLREFLDIDDADDLPDYEYRRFVSGRVKDVLKQYGPAQVPLSESERELPTLPEGWDEDV